MNTNYNNVNPENSSQTDPSNSSEGAHSQSSQSSLDSDSEGPDGSAARLLLRQMVSAVCHVMDFDDNSDSNKIEQIEKCPIVKDEKEKINDCSSEFVNDEKPTLNPNHTKAEPNYTEELSKEIALEFEQFLHKLEQDSVEENLACDEDSKDVFDMSKCCACSMFDVNY